MTHERRAAPRAAIDVPIHFSADAGAQPARLKNISTSGLACHYAEPLDEMSLMSVDLQLPKRDARHKMEGVVVRCEKIRGVSPPTYEIAIYFTDIAPGARVAIHEFVTETLGVEAG